MTHEEREALVERIARALCNAERLEAGWPFVSDDEWHEMGGYDRYMRLARAALAAVAPLIAARERERVLQVLSAHEAGYAKARASYQAAQNAEMTAFVGGKETALGVAIHAIRALGDEG